MLDKKQIWAIFLFKFKMDHRAVETTGNTNDGNMNGWWTYSAEVAQGVLQRRREPWNEVHSSPPSEADNNQLILLQLHEKSPKNSTSTILWSFGTWSKLGRWNGCLVSWPQIRKIILKCYLLLSYATTRNHFSIGLWCVTKSGFYTTTSDEELSGWTKKKLQALLKAELAPKEGSWSLFGGLLPVWSTTAFWIPVKPVHLRSMLSKSMRCIKNCHACNKYWSTKGQCFSTTMSDCMSHNQCFKSWTNWAPKLCLIHHIHLTSHQKLTTSLSISTTFFAGETLPQRVGGRKCFPRVHWILKHGFYASGINQFISHWQKCVHCNSFHFD